MCPVASGIPTRNADSPHTLLAYPAICSAESRTAEASADRTEADVPTSLVPIGGLAWAPDGRCGHPDSQRPHAILTCRTLGPSLSGATGKRVARPFNGGYIQAWQQ